MIYLIVNIILLIILGIIFLYLKKEADCSLFFVLGYIGLKYYLCIICPIAITGINLILLLSLNNYNYIKFALLPLIIIPITILVEMIPEIQYKHTYKKYNDIICEKTKEYLTQQNIDLTDSHIGTTYGKNTWSKEANGKLQCCVHINLKDKNIIDTYRLIRSKNLTDTYNLTHATAKYLKTQFPDIYFETRIQNKNETV